MKSLTRKPEVKAEVDACIQAYRSNGLNNCVQILNQGLLSAKIKFPLLEYAAIEFYKIIAENEQIDFCDKIARLRTIGGNVLIGIVLQKRLQDHFEESINKAACYMEIGAEWYVTDIIGERVFGYSLLTQPKKTLPAFKELSKHKDNWVVRSLGAGAHYAIKKGLEKSYVEKVFQLLLSMGQAKNRHVKQGIGWSAKTTAKFHPDIIEKYRIQIDDPVKIGAWFRTKVRIGLERNAYAKRNRS